MRLTTQHLAIRGNVVLSGPFAVHSEAAGFECTEPRRCRPTNRAGFTSSAAAQPVRGDCASPRQRSGSEAKPVTGGSSLTSRSDRGADVRPDPPPMLCRRAGHRRAVARRLRR